MANLGGKDILSSAGAVAALDLVVSADTMLVHLAGSLGRPAWLVLHHLADWRWPFSGDKTYWYPNARLFRRSTPGWDSAGWGDLSLELTAALTTLSGR